MRDLGGRVRVSAGPLPTPSIERIVEREFESDLLVVVRPVQDRESLRDRAEAVALLRPVRVGGNIRRMHDAPDLGQGMVRGQPIPLEETLEGTATRDVTQ